MKLTSDQVKKVAKKEFQLKLKGKQVIVVYAPGHIGREIWEIRRGLFKVSIENMGL